MTTTGAGVSPSRRIRSTPASTAHMTSCTGPGKRKSAAAPRIVALTTAMPRSDRYDANGARPDRSAVTHAPPGIITTSGTVRDDPAEEGTYRSSSRAGRYSCVLTCTAGRSASDGLGDALSFLWHAARSSPSVTASAATCRELTFAAVSGQREPIRALGPLWDRC